MSARLNEPPLWSEGCELACLGRLWREEGRLEGKEGRREGRREGGRERWNEMGADRRGGIMFNMIIITIDFDSLPEELSLPREFVLMCSAVSNRLSTLLRCTSESCGTKWNRRKRKSIQMWLLNAPIAPTVIHYYQRLSSVTMNVATLSSYKYVALTLFVWHDLNHHFCVHAHSSVLCSKPQT